MSTRLVVRLRRRQQQPREDDPEQDGVVVGGTVAGLECHGLVDDPEADGGGGDGGEALEPAEHGSREGLHQERGRQDLADR